jgi:hypothetical protein
MKRVIHALHEGDWRAAGEVLGTMTPSEQRQLAAQLPPELDAELADGRLFDAVWAAPDAPDDLTALLGALRPLAAEAPVDRERGLLRAVFAAQLAALQGDPSEATRGASVVLRAHASLPCPRAATEAAWLIATLARASRDRATEANALTLCASAAARVGSDRRLKAAAQRLRTLRQPLPNHAAARLAQIHD